MATLDERCRVYCGCDKCCAYPSKQRNCNWTQAQLDECRFGQLKHIIAKEIRLNEETD